MITKIFAVSEKIDVQRPFLIFTFLICLVPAIFAQTAQPTPTRAEDEVVKISTSLIQLDVTVTDKSGKVISDLRQDEIEIYENGQKQDISNFSFVSSVKTGKTGGAKKEEAVKPDVPALSKVLRPEQVRRTIALVVDDLSLSFESAHAVRRALKKYVDEQMRDGDLVAIIRTGGGIGALQQFSADKKMLYAAIERVRWNPNGKAGMAAFAPIEDIPDSIRQEDAEDKKARENFEADAADYRSGFFATGTLGALKYIVTGMGQLPGRKSVILFSDGFEIAKVLEFLKQLIETANRASVVFYGIDARGLQDTGITAQDKVNQSPQRLQQILSARGKELLDMQDGLVILSKGTGGFASLNKNDLNESVRKVLDDQSYYLVGYLPDSETFDPKTRRFNKIDIKVKRPGAQVRYRSGFFNVADMPTGLKPVNETPIYRLTEALTSPFGLSKISLRLNALFGNNAQGSFVTALLHIDTRDLKFTEGPSGTKRIILDILATSFGDNGIPIDSVAKTLTFDIKPEIYEQVLKEGFACNFIFPVQKPGAYQFRVAVQDAQAQTVGSASQFIEIPDLTKNRLSISGVLLENFNRDQWRRFTGETATLPAGAESKPIEPTNSFTDTSTRRFKRGTVLRYGFEVYDATGDPAGKTYLKTQIRLFHDDKLVMDGQTLPVDSTGQTDPLRILSGGAITLTDNMPVGDYVLQIIVTDEIGKDKRKVATQSVQFEILD